MGQATVAIVIPCFNQKRFLAKAIESALRQTAPAREVIVVDDGSNEELSGIAARYPAVTFIRQENRGLAGARNAGVRVATSDRMVFLDSDDRLLPNAVAAGLACFEANPEAAFVYGGFDILTGKRRETELQRVTGHHDLVRTNWIGMIATAMFDRRKLIASGGFDESLGMCEDWDLFLRLSREHIFASHGEIVAEYVRHQGNMSNDVARLRKWIDVVRSKEWDRGLDTDGRQAWEEGEQIWLTRVPDPVRRSRIERAARKAARALLRPFRT